MKYLFYILLILIGLFVGYFISNSIQQKALPTVSHSIIQQQLEKIIKLAVVEASFVETKSIKDPDIPFSMFDPLEMQLQSLFPRSTHIKVEGKVHVGYDLENTTWDFNETTKTLTIHNFPPASILSVDHKILHLEQNESYFHTYSNEEDFQFVQSARAMIEQAASHSEVFQEAESQKKDLFELIKLSMKNMNWETQFEEKPIDENQFQKDLKEITE